MFKDYEKHKEWMRNYNKTHKSIRYHLPVKREVLIHYGGGKLACVKCNFNDIRALSIDHINGKGNEHRRELGNMGGYMIYYWLRRNGYPAGYQTLCMNCQFIKRIEAKEYYNKITV